MPSVAYDSLSFIVTNSRSEVRRCAITGASFDPTLMDPALWSATLKRLRAVGFNTVTMRVPWSMHQPTRECFEFAGACDIRRAICEAAAADLRVILRIGPVVGGSFAAGGLPVWIAEIAEDRARQAGGAFMHSVAGYWRRLLREFVDLQASRVGPSRERPILAIGLEDDWRCLDAEVGHAYFKDLVRYAREFGIDVPLFSANNCWYAHEGVIDTWRQGASVFRNLIELRELHPDAPRMAFIARERTRAADPAQLGSAVARTIAAAVAARAEFVLEAAVAHAHRCATSAPTLAQTAGLVVASNGELAASAFALRRVLTFASSFAPALASLRSTATVETARDAEHAHTPVVCALRDGGKARVSVVFAPLAHRADTKRPAKKTAKKAAKKSVDREAFHIAADDTTHAVAVGSASGVEFYASDLPMGKARLDHCTGSLVALVDDLLVIAGAPRAKLTLSVNSSKATLTVPADGAMLKVTKVRSLRVLSVPFVLADGIDVRDGVVAFVDASGATLFEVARDGSVKRGTPPKPERVSTKPLELSAVTRVSVAGLRDGTDARFAHVSAPLAIGAYGLRDALGYYKATWSEPAARAKAKSNTRILVPCSSAVRTQLTTSGREHTLVAEVHEGQLPAAGPQCAARIGVFGPVVEVVPLKGVTCADVIMPSFDAGALGRFIHGYDARGGAKTLQWSFAARTSAVVVECPLDVEGALRLNGEIVAILGGAATPRMVLLDAAKLSPMRPAKRVKGEKVLRGKAAKMVAGSNELLLDIHTPLDAQMLKSVRKSMQLLEITREIPAQWSFARVLAPASWVLGKPASAAKTPTWFRTTFTLDSAQALTLTATHLNAAHIFINGVPQLAHDGVSASPHTRTARIAAEHVRVGTNELTMFDSDGVMPRVTLHIATA